MIHIWVEDKDDNIYDLWRRYINIGKLMFDVYEDEDDEYEVKYNTEAKVGGWDRFDL